MGGEGVSRSFHGGGGGNLGSEEVGKSMGGGEGVAILCIVWSKVRKESQSKW